MTHGVCALSALLLFVLFKGVKVRRWGKEMKELVRVADHSRLLRKCREKAALIVRVEELVGWRRPWDELLVYKSRHLEGLQALSRLMSHHGSLVLYATLLILLLVCSAMSY